MIHAVTAPRNMSQLRSSMSVASRFLIPIKSIGVFDISPLTGRAALFGFTRRRPVPKGKPAVSVSQARRAFRHCRAGPCVPAPRRAVG